MKPTTFSSLETMSGAPEVVNLSVRIDDSRAFRAVIGEREAMIERGQFAGLSKRERDRAMIDQMAGRALDALVEIKSTNADRQLVAANLQSCAAIAIAALSTLKAEGGAQ